MATQNRNAIVSVLISALLSLSHCQNTTSTAETTSGIQSTSIYTTSDGCLHTDISPNNNICSDLADWGSCAETWVTGYCCNSCGDASCADYCRFDCINDVELNAISCANRVEWGNCADLYMEGYCCPSCPEACASECYNNNENNVNFTTTMGDTLSTTPTPLTNSNNNSTDYNCKDVDISPNNDISCSEIADWGSCTDEWVSGHCCKSCDLSCSNGCRYDCVGNVELDGVACADRVDWGNCPDVYMQGWCCLSCPEACASECEKYDINTDNISWTTHDYNYSNSISNCKKDVPPPPGPNGVINTCLSQYRWGNCGESWMEEYCCLTCGYTSCLETCWEGIVENIPSEYYPNPFDCENNDFVEGEQDSCPDETEWGNCAESWMFGLCCVSCPEACNCLTYSWSNNTDYIDLRPDVIVAMSLEEIRHWERVFVSLHSVMLFFIFIILGMTGYKIFLNKYINNIASKLTMAGTTSGSIEGVTTSPTPGMSDTDMSVASNVSAKSNSNSTMTSNSRVKKLRANPKQKVLLRYKILAIVSVSMWILVINLHQMSLFMYDRENVISLDANETWTKSWAILRTIIYTLSKMLMFISFIVRINDAFKGSSYKYSLKFMGFLYAYLTMDTILKLIANTEKINKLAGDVTDKQIFEGNQTEYWLYWILILIAIEESIFTVLLIGAFVRPLYTMSQRAQIISTNVLNIMSKYVVLGIFCIVSSTIISVSQVFYIATTDLMVVWSTALLESFDCVINIYCTIFLFGFASNWYQQFCSPCNKSVQSIYLKKYKNNKRNSGIEMI